MQISKEHGEFCFTPKYYATEEQFVKLARAQGKACIQDGVEYLEDPFPMKRRDLYDLRGTWKRRN